MASLVVKACGSTSCQMGAVTIQEKGSRNKRKFRADPPLVDPNKVIPLPSGDFSGFEFSAEKFDAHGLVNGCGICCANQNTSDALKLDLGLSCIVGTSEAGVSRAGEEMEASADEFHDADWSDFTESELEELVLMNLDTIFKSAIKRIVASGYNEDVAAKAILRSSLWYGCKDTVSNIVDNTLSFLRSGSEIDISREHYFEDLHQMEKYVLAELVCLLREVRPFFSIGDAMWCLLICDMNVSHACAMDGDTVGSFLCHEPSAANCSGSAQPQLTTELKSSESNAVVPCKPNEPIASVHNWSSNPLNLASVHGVHDLQLEAPNINESPSSKPRSSFVLNGLVSDLDYQNSASKINEKPFSATGVTHDAAAEEKFVGSRKASGMTKREAILRQKLLHSEKRHPSNGFRGKLNSFSGRLVLDKELKSVADSTGLTAKNAPLNINKANGFDVPADSTSATAEFNSMPTVGVETAIDHSSSSAKSSISSTLSIAPVDTSASLPVTDTELSLTFPATSIANPVPISYNIEAARYSYLNLSNNSSLGQWTSQDRKDDTAMKLVPRVRELQNQLHEWTEWANQKVMQAARRLSKDKAELKMLKQEKEEAERLKKEKKTLEENTVKKLSEMEIALRKASMQVERANAVVRRLEVENAGLRQEMETAKLRAVESAASCQEVSKREKKTLMRFQSWEKQKTILQEELSAENLKLMQMQQKLQQAKGILNQVVEKLNQEEKTKEELLAQISSTRKEREQIELSGHSKEDKVKLRAGKKQQKYKEDIAKLEKEISQLRLKMDSSKIAALREGINGNYACKLSEFIYTPALKASTITCISKMVSTANLQHFTGNGGVKRERECVMCLSEEMSVVFLPCAHQVVCTTCNELHKKQGMKDCPSCRSPIQQRICVRYAHS